MSLKWDDILVRCCGFHKICSISDKIITTSSLNYEEELQRLRPFPFGHDGRDALCQSRDFLPPGLPPSGRGREASRRPHPGGDGVLRR